MPGDSSPQTESTGLRLRSQWLLVGVGAVAYTLVVLSGFAALLTGAALRSLAMATLGGALALLVAARLGPSAPPRLGARAQAQQRRCRALALASVGALYVVLAGGALVTDGGGMWSCQALPICPTPNELALAAMAHRVMAALVTLLLVALTVQTWQLHDARGPRRAAGWVLGLIMLQNAAGIAQLLLLGSDPGVLAAARGGHLLIGAATWSALVVLATLALRLPIAARATEAVPAQPAQPSLLKDYISLTKPGVISLLIFTTLAAMFITPAGLPSPELVFWTLLGGWLMPAGAHALNCYFDRDIDIMMGRTGRRPLPSNRIPPWHALALGLTLAAAAFVILAVFVNLLTAWLALAGFVYYVGIYTLWLKRSSPSNIVIGGGAGAFPPLIGWAAVTGELTLASLFLFAIIFYWTPPHFWALALIRRKDYANANVPMLPVVAGDDETKRQIVLYTIQMVVLTLLLTPLQLMGLPYLLMAAVLGGIFGRYAWRLYREGSTPAAWGLYKFSLLYLALLFVAMMIDRLAFG